MNIENNDIVMKHCPHCESICLISKTDIDSSRAANKLVCISCHHCQKQFAIDGEQTKDRKIARPADLKIVTCPSCKKGSLLKRRARRGNFFYSCSGYPKCKYIISHPPLNEPCVNCNFPITMHKVTKTKGEQIVCPECQHTRAKE